jgi:hypothetical protein
VSLSIAEKTKNSFGYDYLLSDFVCQFPKLETFHFKGSSFCHREISQLWFVLCTHPTIHTIDISRCIINPVSNNIFNSLSIFHSNQKKVWERITLSNCSTTLSTLKQQFEIFTLGVNCFYYKSDILIGDYKGAELSIELQKSEEQSKMMVYCILGKAKQADIQLFSDPKEFQEMMKLYPRVVYYNSPLFLKYPLLYNYQNKYHFTHGLIDKNSQVCTSFADNYLFDSHVVPLIFEYL